MTAQKHEAPKANQGSHTARTKAEEDALAEKAANGTAGASPEAKAVLPVPYKGTDADRVEAVRLALEAHRGKGLGAEEIVKEAAIIERYLIEGAGNKAQAEIASPTATAVDAGMPKAT